MYAPLHPVAAAIAIGGIVVGGVVVGIIVIMVAVVGVRVVLSDGKCAERESAPVVVEPVVEAEATLRASMPTEATANKAIVVLRNMTVSP
jgi:flagellar basal body-associated protein FliL